MVFGTWTTIVALTATLGAHEVDPGDPGVSPDAEATALTPIPWGFVGHEMAARAAAGILPAEMPAFFRGATDQFVHLNPEPDRWRDFDQREMDQAFSYDHYIDLENVPDGALDATDRFTFLAELYEADLPKPERDVGFLPFRIVELYQRIVAEWRMWRQETDPQRRYWIEARILNDAGVLGHYVTDGSQPHHTTIHFNGWNDSDAFGNAVANPEGYTEDNQFHGRFERFFVEAHVEQEHVSSRVRGAPRSVAGEARPAVLAYLHETFSTIEELYRIDRDVGFDTDAGRTLTGPETEARDFAADRLAAGAEMLAVLWWSAWLESAS